jgi:hypothetical protein
MLSYASAREDEWGEGFLPKINHGSWAWLGHTIRGVERRHN